MPDAPAANQPDGPSPPHRRRRRVIGAVAAAIVVTSAFVLVAVLLRNERQPEASSPKPAPTTTGQPPSTGTITGQKDPISGLIDRNGPPDPKLRDVIAAYVVNVPWADLQPQPDGPIAAGNPIDKAIDEVRRLNQADPEHPLRLKIRLTA